MTEPRRPPQDMVTFEEHFKALLTAQREYFEVRLRGFDKETIIAKTEVDRRLESMNEFRKQLERQESTYLKIDDFGQWRSLLEQSVREIREWKAGQEGKASSTSVWINTGLAISALVLAIYAAFGKH